MSKDLKEKMNLAISTLIGLAACYLMFKFSYKWLEHLGVETFIKFDETKSDSDGNEIEGITPIGVQIMGLAIMMISLKLGNVIFHKKPSIFDKNSNTLWLDIAIICLVILSAVHIVLLDVLINIIANNSIYLIASLGTTICFGFVAYKWYERIKYNE